MKKIALLISLIGLLSCNNNPKNNGSSTPIDSTNLNGKPAATYGGTDPAQPAPPKNEGSLDSGLRANTASSEDSLQHRK